MAIPNNLLENMIRHCEIKRANACDMLETSGEFEEFNKTMGELELSFWTDMFEALNELAAYRKAIP